MEFTSRLIAFRRAHPSLRRTAWLHEHAAPGIDHVGWFTPAGEEMRSVDWTRPFARAVAIYLDGRAIHAEAGSVTDDDLLVMFNGYPEPIEFSIPDEVGTDGWLLAFDTAEPEEGNRPVKALTADVAAFGLVALVRRR